MANMSYCRFENTNNDLVDCINAIGQAIENGQTHAEFMAELNEYERSAIKRLLGNCAQFIEYMEELENEP